MHSVLCLSAWDLQNPGAQVYTMCTVAARPPKFPKGESLRCAPISRLAGGHALSRNTERTRKAHMIILPNGLVILWNGLVVGQKEYREILESRR